MLSPLFMLVSSVLLLSMVHFSFPYPFHASCKIKWTFGIECSSVANGIMNQIKAWKGEDCGDGEKCLYQFDSYKNNVLKAKHKTPKNHYVDDLTFTFEADGSACSVDGDSSSEVWYAILDYSTNYCNLHNLIEGAGLDNVTGYSETTSNSVCTQYTSRNCQKY